MNFLNWKLLQERIERPQLEREGKKLKEIAEELKDFYCIPDFETFSRPGEPEQINTLFTDEDLNTFSINYKFNGEIYSLDFWKGLDPHPIVTYYVRKGTTLEEIAKSIPAILSNPSRRGPARTPRHKVLQESLDPQEPKETTSLDADVRKAEKDTGIDYEYGDPDTIFDDLKLYVDMIIDKVQPSLLITGSPGIGKTFTVLKQLKDAGLKRGEDYIHIKGRSTAVAMYTTLYEYNGQIIVFDDCDSIFSSGDGVNVLAGALDSTDVREISWLVGKPIKGTAGREIPKHFEFTGSVIFISNLPQRKIDSKLKSRSFVLEVALTPSDMIKKMRNELGKISPEVPMIYKRDALDLIENASKTSHELEISMRTLVKAIKILRVVDNMTLAKRLILQQCSYK